MRNDSRVDTRHFASVKPASCAQLCHNAMFLTRRCSRARKNISSWPNFVVTPKSTSMYWRAFHWKQENQGKKFSFLWLCGYTLIQQRKRNLLPIHVCSHFWCSPDNHMQGNWGGPRFEAPKIDTDALVLTRRSQRVWIQREILGFVGVFIFCAILGSF